MYILKRIILLAFIIFLFGCGGSGTSKNSVRIDSVNAAKNSVYEISLAVKNMSNLERKSIDVINIVLADLSTASAPMQLAGKHMTQHLKTPIFYKKGSERSKNLFSKVLPCPGGGTMEINGSIEFSEEDQFGFVADLHECIPNESGGFLTGRMNHNGHRSENDLYISTGFDSVSLQDVEQNLIRISGEIVFEYDYVNATNARTLNIEIEDHEQTLKYDRLVIEENGSGSFINGSIEILKSLHCVEGGYRIRTLEALTKENAVITVNNATLDYEENGAWVAYDDKSVFIEFPQMLTCNE